jgi:hypothetical protein
VGFQDAWKAREEGIFGGVAVAFIGREHFIQNKRAAGRARDLADIQAITDARDHP